MVYFDFSCLQSHVMAQKGFITMITNDKSIKYVSKIKTVSVL